MKYRIDFVTNSSSSSSIVLRVNTNKNVYICEYYSDSGNVLFGPLLNIDMSNATYENMIRFFVNSKYNEINSTILRDEIKYSKIHNVLSVDVNGNVSFDKKELETVMKVKLSDESRDLLTMIDELDKCLIFTCNDYDTFVRHPLWKTKGYNFAEGERIQEFIETCDIRGDYNQIAETKVDLKKLKFVTRDTEDISYEISEILDQMEENGKDTDELRERLEDSVFNLEEMEDLLQELSKKKTRNPRKQSKKIDKAINKDIEGSLHEDSIEQGDSKPLLGKTSIIDSKENPIECLLIEDLSDEQYNFVMMISEGKDKQAAILLKKGFKWNFSFDRNVNLLHLAIMFKCDLTAQFLIENNIDLMQETSDEANGDEMFAGEIEAGISALMIAFAMKNKGIISLIKNKLR